MTTTTPTVETSLPLESLLRLRQRGLGAFPLIQDLAIRGDWRTRALALSALGELVRDDPTVWRRAGLRRWGGYVPFLRRRWPTAGPHGAYIRGPLLNAFTDRSWIVRAAAALAIGECGDARLASRLEPLLSDHLRPVRMCAAAALLASGAPTSAGRETILAGEAAPHRIGDTQDARAWIERLVRAHAGVVRSLVSVLGASSPARDDVAAWARLIAGEAAAERAPDPQAEVLRYAQEKENHYNFIKPFAPGAREQNTRLLHSFLVLSEHLNVPLGGRVLDLGGGAGWVSELLAKLGYVPVTLDIAPALLRIGRDRFTREHLPGRFLAGDMTALPFPARSVDAVMIVDALHHVGDVPAVFREAHRVLVEGGQFLIAEPGEGHAESEKSRGEMSEHGVCEREIHLFEVIRYARAAGFTETRVVPHYVPGIYLTPEDLEEAMAAPSERWRVRRDEGQVSRFDEHLMQSLLSHPVLVCGKGRRTLDSRAPRRLRATLEQHLERRGSAVSGHVRVTNVGDTIWLKGGDEAGRVRLGVQLMTPERKLLNQDFDRGLLPEDVSPGGAVEVALRLALPDAERPYVLKLDMVDEHICWFEDMGSTPMYLSV